MKVKGDPCLKKIEQYMSFGGDAELYYFANSR